MLACGRLMMTKNWRARFLEIDRALLLALIVAFAFCLHGIHWGRVEDWNPDEMALRGLSWKLKPHEFLKPPFHTFLNHVLVVWPLSLAEFNAKIMTKRPQNFDGLKLLASRLITTAMFLGTIVMAFKIADKFYDRRAARIIAWFLATSAGFIAYEHFLTADTPVVFWMVLAMFFASRIILEPTAKNYLAAGLATGLAAATKYNGLAVGLAIPVAHVLSQPWNWRAFLPNRRLFLGLAMVLIGFILGNPYAVFDWPKFSEDFAYNYAVTPRYSGQTGLGFGKFAQGIFNILGLPGGSLIVILVIVSGLLLVRPRLHRYREALRAWQKGDGRAAKCYLLLASVFLLYALKFGAFPRVPTRFVLPAVPFFILMAGPALQMRWLRTKWIVVALVPIFFYNCVCSFYVGQRFRDDPRMAAQVWVEKNIPPGSHMESSSGSPHWRLLSRVNAVELQAEQPKWERVRPQQIADVRMPRPNNRAEFFARVFAGDEKIVDLARKRERPPDESQFTLEKLQERNPNYITVYSGAYGPPIVVVRKYYEDLLQGNFPYKVVADFQTPAVPHWIYPGEIDFLGGRMTILSRQDDATAR